MLETIINKTKNLIRKTLPYALATSIAITSTYALVGCSKKKKDIIIPPATTIVTGPVQTDISGQVNIKDASGDQFYITVKDEKTLEPLENMQIYTIDHSTEIVVKDLLEQYISEVRITDPGSIEILMSKLNDRITDNLPEHKMWFHPEPINWSAGATKIAENIPLSQLDEFYETNEITSVDAFLEVTSNYSGVFTVAKAFWKIRSDVINASDDIAKILGINPNLILYDIYREKTTGVLYHVRADNNPVGNIKPVVSIETLRGEFNGNIPINYTLGDANADLCNIVVEYSTDNGLTFTSVTEGPGSDGVTNLNSSIGGVNHTFVWDSLIDNVGTSISENVQIKITPWDSEEGLEGIIAGFNIKNGDIWKSSDPAANDSTPGVQDLTPMPTARYDMTSAIVNNKIYVIGGVLNINKVEEYDPSTDIWTTKAPMPTGRCLLTCSAVNGKIYAVGGVNYGVEGYKKVEEYNPTTNTWTSKLDMPSVRYEMVSSAVNGKIYVIGGERTGGGGEDLVEEYDPSTDIWITKAPMPTGRNDMTSSVVNGKIYVIGGYDYISGITTNAMEEYNPTTNTWTTKAPMPTLRKALTSSVVNGKIYVIGGWYIDSDLRTVEEYDPTTNIWTTGVFTDMPSARKDMVSSTIDDKIYVIGGWYDQGMAGQDLNITEEYTPPK